MFVLRNILDKKIKRLFQLEGVDYKINLPSSFDDASSNLAFILAGRLKRSARKIAEQIQQDFSDYPVKLVRRVSFAEPGFINFEFNSVELFQLLSREEFSFQASRRLKIQVEFISANPTGPLTLGNGRGGFMGDAIANILSQAGHRVEREYYINDQGGQIEKLGNSILEPEKAVYRGEYMEEIRNKMTNILRSQNNAQAVGRQAADLILKDYIQAVVQKLNIRFDSWQKESELYQRYQIEDLLADLKKRGLAAEREGQIWFLSTRWGDDKNRVLKKKNSEYTYLASDMLYLQDRRRRGFQKLILLWGADHHGYVKRFLAAAQALGWKKEQIKIILVQLVRLKIDGKSERMSKRAGRIILLDELVEKVGLDAARYFFLEKSAGVHLDFDLATAMRRDLTNPVYYIQYAYVRSDSILRKSRQLSAKTSSQTARANGADQPMTKPDRQLILTLLSVAQKLRKISQNLEVHQLTSEALRLARTWHNFYEKEKVISSSGKVHQQRLILADKTHRCLGKLLDLMSISQPEKM